MSEEFDNIVNNILNAKPLEPEFAKLLNDNLWDLLDECYVSEDNGK